MSEVSLLRLTFLVRFFLFNLAVIATRCESCLVEKLHRRFPSTIAPICSFMVSCINFSSTSSRVESRVSITTSDFRDFRSRSRWRSRSVFLLAEDVWDDFGGLTCELLLDCCFA